MAELDRMREAGGPLVSGSRPAAGLALMAGGVTAGLAAYFLGRYGAGEWVLAVYLWLSFLALGAYALAVYRPTVETWRRLEELRREMVAHQAALSEAMEALREGDLVATEGPAAALPGHLAEAARAAAHGLARLVSELQEASVAVASAASRIHATASELASGSSEQAAAVVEITATMDELARTAAQIAQNAARQAAVARDVRDRSESGTAAVEAAVEGVEAVRARIAAIGERTATLDMQSKEIFRILDLISEIAHETHILALNAAIEASDAGASGGRFSAVADEVGRLAERSRESVRSVRAIVEELQAAVRSTVVATEEGLKEAEKVAERARTAAEAIVALRETIEETERAAREISAATEEQRGASDQVAQTLREVGDVVQREAEGLQEFQRAAADLSRLALSIQLLAQAFRVDSPRSLKHAVTAWAAELDGVVDQPQVVTQTLETLVARHGYVELAYLVDAEGRMVGWAAARRIPEERAREAVQVGRSYAERPWFQAADRARGATVTPLYRSLLTGEQCFTVAVRLPGGGGVLGVDVNLRSWTEI